MSFKSDNVGGRRLRLDIRAATGAECVPFVRKHLLAAQGMTRNGLRELSLALVGDQRMSRLHKQFLGVAGPTDVITFDLEHDARGRVQSGEIVLCVPEARRQSRRRGAPLCHEVLLYALHGLLHLSGFDDALEGDYRRMHQREDTILSRLGIGRVFASPVKATGRGSVFSGAKRCC